MNYCKIIEKILLHSGSQLHRQDFAEQELEHLKTCTSCKTLYDTLAIVEHAMSQHGEVPMPDENYFEQLPKELIQRIDRSSSLPAHNVHNASTPSWFERLFAQRYFKPALAFAFVAFIATVIVQSLPEGAQFTLVKNSQKVGSATDDIPQEQPVVSMQTQPQSSPKAEKGNVANSVPAKSAREQGISAPTEKDAGQIDQPVDALVSLDASMRVASPEKKSESTLALTEEKQALQVVDQTRSLIAADSQPETGYAAFGQEAGLASGRSAPLNAFKLAGEKGAVAFSVFFRRAQSAESLQKRAEIWQQFLASTRDSSQYALGLVELSKATKSMAEKSTDPAMLANAVSWFERNEKTLRPLMGEQEFLKHLSELKERLQRARTGQLR